MNMFTQEQIERCIIKHPKKGLLRRLVSWWRRITGRDVYHVGIDSACDDGPDHWCRAVYDTKTGVTTILEMGRGEPPANTNDMPTEERGTVSSDCSE